MGRENAVGLAALYLQFVCKFFRQKIDLGNVIVDEVKEIADLFVRCSFHLRGSPPQPVIQLHQLLAILPVGLVGAQSAWAKPGAFCAISFSSCSPGL